jgi:hypothetical protein
MHVAGGFCFSKPFGKDQTMLHIPQDIPHWKSKTTPFNLDLET